MGEERDLPAEEFYPDPEKNNKWILDTEDSEALKEDIAEYVRRFVKGV